MEQLGLTADSSWESARCRYRALIRALHPDLDPSSEESTRHAAVVNSAWTTLVTATDNGARPLPCPTDQPTEPLPAPMITLRAKPGDVYAQLLDAAHEIGVVSYMDPEAGLIQVLLDNGDPSGSQLLITVNAEDQPTLASFALDRMGAGDTPDITEIVGLIENQLLA